MPAAAVNGNFDQRKSAAISTLKRVEDLLLTTTLDADMQERGWTSELTRSIAESMIECRLKIEDGWLPSVNYSGQWVRLIMERITPPGGGAKDEIDRAIEEATIAVRHFATTAQEYG